MQDASFFRLVLQDLEIVLGNPNAELQPHLDYQIWSESYQALRYSPRATLDVNGHVKRLTGIHKHRQALYPKAALPIEPDPLGFTFGFDASGLLDIKAINPDIGAAVVLKAALALVNVSRTGYTHAIYNNFEAGRGRFPFLSSSMDNAELEGADVGGPTMQIVTNLIEVDGQETALAFVTRLNDDQRELSKRCHAPLARIIEVLNAENPGAGDIIVEMQHTQFMTWVPGILGDYEQLKVGTIVARSIAGLIVAAGIGGPKSTTYMINLRLDFANYPRGEVAALAKDLEKTVLWLTDKDNFDAPVEVVLREINRKTGLS